MSTIEKMKFQFREISTKIDSNVKFLRNVSEETYKTGQPNNIFWTFDFIETISSFINFDEVKVILDIGSRDGFQSLEFRRWFPLSKIIAFEPNLKTIEQCLRNTSGLEIDVIHSAVGNFDGVTDFFICDAVPGCSSTLKINPQHQRSKNWKQTKTSTKITRIDTFLEEKGIESVDLLWIDVQGSEKSVLEGLGEKLYNVKAIHTEVAISEMYEKSNFKSDIDSYLQMFGFVEIKILHMNDEEINSLDEILHLGECDVIYINKKYSL